MARRRGHHPETTPKVRRLEAIAAESGYTPGQVSLMFFGDNQRRIMGWYEDLQRGVVPAELGGSGAVNPGEGLAKAWDTFYAEAADFMASEERWMEYFHGKRQRIESSVTFDDGKPEVTDEPYSEDAWAEEHSLASAAGTAKGSN